MRKNAKRRDIPSSGRILGTYSANFGTRESVPTMPGMPSMVEETATLENRVQFVPTAAAYERWLPTCQDLSHDEVGGAAREDGSLIRKIRASGGLDQSPLPCPSSRAGGLLGPGLLTVGAKTKKSSGFVPLALTYSHARRRSRESANPARHFTELLPTPGVAP